VKEPAEELGRRLTLAREDLSEPPQDKKPARRRFGDGWSIYPPSPIGAPEAHGETSLEAITIANSQTGEVKTVRAKALFIFIGAMPRTDWLADIVGRDEQGYILTGSSLLGGGQRPQEWMLDRDPFLLETSVPGIFVAGDVRSGSVKRVASGVGEGSIAVQFIHHYLSGVK
jgi:thioredoxin reductase (NADPH)